ncbi:MAG: ankyrin repeat domain-containing protein [Steroidobacter sp.]
MSVAALAQGQREGGHTPLHAAAWNGDVAQIESLIAGGADVNSTSSFGTTPLHSAAVRNQLQAVKALLQRGARVDARDGLGRTPLFAALQLGVSRPVIEALLDAGASADAKDNSGKTPVDVAWTDELRTLLKQHLVRK